MQLLSRLKKLPFTLGRVVDTSGACWFDSVIALLEIPILRVGLSQRAQDIKTHQGYQYLISLILNSKPKFEFFYIIIISLYVRFCGTNSGASRKGV